MEGEVVLQVCEQGSNSTLALSGAPSWGREMMFSAGSQDRDGYGPLGGRPELAQAWLVMGAVCVSLAPSCSCVFFSSFLD